MAMFVWEKASASLLLYFRFWLLRVKCLCQWSILQNFEEFHHVLLINIHVFGSLENCWSVSRKDFRFPIPSSFLFTKLFRISRRSTRWRILCPFIFTSKFRPWTMFNGGKKLAFRLVFPSSGFYRRYLLNKPSKKPCKLYLFRPVAHKNFWGQVRNCDGDRGLFQKQRLPSEIAIARFPNIQIIEDEISFRSPAWFILQKKKSVGGCLRELLAALSWFVW